MPASQLPASPTHVDSAKSAGSNKETSMKNTTLSHSALRSTGTNETTTSQMVNRHLNAQCMDCTVVVGAALLLAQAKPRSADAVASATHIYTTLFNSKQLTEVSGDLQTLVEGQCTSEKATYPGMRQLFDLIARAVYNEVVQLGPTDPVRQETRLLQSTSNFDYVATGSDNHNQPDMAVVAQAVPADDFPSVAAKEQWCNIALVVEGKRDNTAASKGTEPSQASLDKARGQLARYVLNLYTSQPNRRFAWALITINTFVYVYLFGRDRALCTQPINLATLAGRQLFARFLIFWSLAGPVQFGLDPTIEYDATTQHWAITCFDDASSPPTQRVYYAPDDTIVIQSSLFGRRTIAFSVSKTPGEKPTMFVKDAWPVATAGVTKDDDLRNEIVLLRLIRKGFSENDPGVPYLKLEMGGVVQQRSHCDLARDDTELAFGAIEAALSLSGSESKSPTPVYRVHRRMAMTPLAERLNTLDDFNQLIVVLADAMTCHYKLYNDHRIFHRDISTNNVMVVRENERLQGILVDYDYAVHRDAAPMPGRPERTGTLPFMSIGNLEGNDNPRTALDDWESLLYVICWLGTFGVGKKASGKSTKPSAPIPMLHRWLKGSMETVAQDKRNAMDSLAVFGGIAACYQDLPGNKLLTSLAVKLYRALFQHHNCQGAKIIEDFLLEAYDVTANSGEKYDPLKNRVKYEEEITAKCYQILQDAANVACFELLSVSP